ncbi:hypothetical protein ACFX15_023358 [Malus domestica]|uniref:LysM domain-containing protein n=1 Tax=Malus domestica TaxID=3750 RepID=A0A498HG68_MALDO|nr:hypothetical protein DVH24_028278 [Malus domestica]
MAKANNKMATTLNLILVLSLVLMISIAESRQLGTVGFGEKGDVVCESVYGAEEGDTCESVIQKFKLTSDSFLSINPNLNCDNFFVGQWLCTEGTVN